MLSNNVIKFLTFELKDTYFALRYYEDALKYDSNSPDSIKCLVDDIADLRSQLKGMVYFMTLSGVFPSDVSVRRMYDDFTFISGDNMKPIFCLGTSYRSIEYSNDSLSSDYRVQRREKGEF